MAGMSASTGALLAVGASEVAARLDEIVDELLSGSGCVVVPQAVDPDDVAEARELLMEYSSTEGDKVTHFHGAHEEQLSLQRRVWNLLNKGEVFERMAQLAPVMAILDRFLGSLFHMGSIAANRILPGGPAQEPHIDYPYWDLHEAETFPLAINASFPLNAQATIMLDDFTEQNGATAFLPGTQLELQYPDDEADFAARAIRMTGRAGDVAVFNGACWHAAQANHSERDRVGVLIQYLPKFVKPLEDQLAALDPEVLDRASPRLRQLIGIDYPYPQVLDEADAANTEGRYSRR